jgi:hypothetical protein
MSQLINRIVFQSASIQKLRFTITWAVMERSFPCNVSQFPVESILMSSGESLEKEKPRSSSRIWLVLIPKSNRTASAHKGYLFVRHTRDYCKDVAG